MSSKRRTAPPTPLWRRAARLPRTARKLLRDTAYVSDTAALMPGNEISLLVDGGATFASMLGAIGRARRYVHLETYIWEADRIGTQFAEALMDRARNGVRVRVIYDSLGSSDLPFEFLEMLKDAKVELLAYRPFRLAGGLGAYWSRRDHRKILVVDGAVSFCGGINIGDEYDSATAGGQGWRDTHVEIRGPLTGTLDSLFRTTWHREKGRPFPAYPSPPIESVAGSRLELAGALVSDGVGQRTTIRRHYLRAINTATSYIFIANAYFVPSRRFLRALIRAARRGVDVRLLLPDQEHSDVLVVQLASQSTYERLLANGVRIYQWPGAHMHAKSAVIDGVWSVVGSYNLDRVSLFRNLEVVIEVLGEEFGESMTTMYESDFARARELELETWRKRPKLGRISEQFLYRFRRFM